MAGTRELYRPVSNLEYTSGDPLSTRFIRDCAENINNYKYHFGCHKIISEFCATASSTQGTDSVSGTSENVIFIFGCFFIPKGLERLRWWINTKRTTGASGTTAWKLYAHDRLYKGPKILDDTYLGDYVSSTITTSSASNVIGYGSIDIVSGVTAFSYAHLLLTADNSTTNISTIYTIDVQLEKV